MISRDNNVFYSSSRARAAIYSPNLRKITIQRVGIHMSNNNIDRSNNNIDRSNNNIDLRCYFSFVGTRYMFIIALHDYKAQARRGLGAILVESFK